MEPSAAKVALRHLEESDKVAVKDPAVEARDLIDNGYVPVGWVQDQAAKLKKGFDQASREAKNLDRLGSGTIEAPTLLKAHVLGPTEELVKLAERIRDHVQDVLKRARR
jgi:hypothetical protein